MRVQKSAGHTDLQTSSIIVICADGSILRHRRASKLTDLATMAH
jgi:hypothetical protein